MRPVQRPRFIFRRADAVPLALALLVLLCWDLGGLDLPLAQLLGGGASLPWREHWLPARLVHDGGRWVSWMLAVALCLGVWWPLGWLRRIPRPRRLQLALATLLSVLVVSTIKQWSPTSCPWDLREFGGLARHLSHWRLQADGGSGHCFPAGHASSGFCFIGGYAAFHPSEPAIARVWLGGALSLGLVFGLAQQVRGAHFMSHTLWSAWICWFVVTCVFAMPRTGLEDA
jgi:membrane-associated PAP2 superfamily phosphatase